MNERQRRFCELYAEDPDGTAAAIGAGYSKRTAASIASENLRKPELLAYIRKLQDQAAEIRIASITEAKGFLSDILRDADQRTADRIKAAELLMRSGGAFVRVREDDDGRTVDAWRSDGGGAVIILPPIASEESCEWPEDDPSEVPEGWEVVE